MKQRTLWPNILLFLISLSIGLGLLETTTRSLDKTLYGEMASFSLTDYSVYTNKPHYSYISARQEFSNRIDFNAKGLRGKELSYEKPQGTKRILMLGDSFVMGREVLLNETATFLLETALNSADPQKPAYEVINMGYGGFGPTAEAILLEKEGMKYGPDVVVLNIYVGNDIAKVDFGTVGTIPQELFDGSDSLDMAGLHTTRIQRLKDLFVRNYFTYTYLRNLAAEKNLQLQSTPYFGDILNKTYSKETDQNFDKAASVIKHFKRYTEKHNIKLLVVIIPLKEQVDKRKYQELADQFSLSSEEVDMTKPQRILLRIGQENNITMLDLLPGFSRQNINNTFYFEIDGHWNKEGQKMASKLIHEKLNSAGYLD